MSEKKYRKLYEKIERGLEQRIAAREQQILEAQREALKGRDVKLNAMRLRHSEQARCFVEQLDIEIANLASERDRTSSMNKRVDLKATILHLREIRARATGSAKRKPPESGLAVPAVPPKGPLPKQGGAAAPLEFGSD